MQAVHLDRLSLGRVILLRAFGVDELGHDGHDARRLVLSAVSLMIFILKHFRPEVVHRGHPVGDDRFDVVIVGKVLSSNVKRGLVLGMVDAEDESSETALVERETDFFDKSNKGHLRNIAVSMQMKTLEPVGLHAERNAESRNGLVSHSLKFLRDALDERVALEPVRSKRQMRTVVLYRSEGKDDRVALFLTFRQFDRRHIEQRLRPLDFI